MVDSDREAVRPLRDHLASVGCEVALASDCTHGLAMLEEVGIDVLIVNAQLPGVCGLELLRVARQRAAPIPTIVISNRVDVAEAVDAMRLGAADVLTTPLDPHDISARIVRILAATDSARQQPSANSPLGFMVGTSPAWLEVVHAITRVAPTDCSVLIEGESGTGKELVARALHATSSRARGRFVAVNCAALPGTLLENELFGHERGAYTGAVARQEGRFEMAHGGTLLLDEVDEIPVELQVKLLRVLQERRIERLGSAEPIEVDVRIIATTKVSLRALIDAGRFRRDLYYRIAVVPIPLPTLVERRADIPELAVHFLRVVSTRMPAAARRISASAMDCLLAYDYPGNVRELEHLIEAACVRSGGDEIQPHHLPPELHDAASRRPFVGQVKPLDQMVREFERCYLELAVAGFSGTREELAAQLGLSRKGLWQKLKRHGLGLREQGDADVTVGSHSATDRDS